MVKLKLVAVQHESEVGGSGIGLLTTLRILRHYFDIVVYCAESTNGMIQLLENSGFTVVPCKQLPTFLHHSGGPRFLSIGFLAPLAKIPKAKEYWRKELIKQRPDYVLVNSMVLSWMQNPIRSCGVKAICHVREVLPKRRGLRSQVTLRNLEKFDAVWFISEHEKGFFRLMNPKTAVIRDCLIDSIAPSSPLFCESKTSDGFFRVLYVGWFSKLKGIRVLMDSIRFLDSRISVCLAGSFPENEDSLTTSSLQFGIVKRVILYLSSLDKRVLFRRLQRTISEHAGRVKVLGHRDNLDDLYNECDVLVFPSTKPHQSRPAFEAGFFAKPVVISDFTQTKENVKNGHNGLTFRPGDGRDLAKKLVRLRNDPALRRELGENNQRNSFQKHTFEAVQADIVSFLERYL